jgi:hypothetical protein
MAHSMEPIELLFDMASADLAIILGAATRNLILSLSDIVLYRAVGFLLSYLFAWAFDMRSELLQEITAAMLMYLSFFRHLDEIKERCSVLWTLISRDRPPDGLPGVEISNAIARSLMASLYILLSVCFHNISATLSTLYTNRIWVSGILGAFVVFCFGNPSLRRRREKRAASSSILAILTYGLVQLGYSIYSVSLLAIELGRNGKFRLRKLLRPYLEHRHFRHPMPLYTYDTLGLEGKEIRLIKLERRYPGYDIGCSLVRFPLVKAPPYEAISYTWGSGGKDHLVLFDGGWLPVTRNVHKILYDRRSYMRPR